MTSAALSRRDWSPFTRYRRSLWLLTTRDLKVRYSTSFLGYFWSILDPLVMAGIYWFVFTVVSETAPLNHIHGSSPVSRKTMYGSCPTPRPNTTVKTNQ